MLAGAVLIAACDAGSIRGAMDLTLFGVAEAVAAVRMEQVGGGHIAPADSGEGLEGDADQAELKQAGPTGPAVGSAAALRQQFGDTGAVGEGVTHEKVSKKKPDGATRTPPGGRD